MCEIQKKLRYLCAIIGCMCLVFAGCGKDVKKSHVANPINFIVGDLGKKVFSERTCDVIEKLISDTKRRQLEMITGPESDPYHKGWKELLKLDEGSLDTAVWIRKWQESNWADFYEAYNGDRLQRITPTDGINHSPANTEDIIFYKAEPDESPGEIAQHMVEAILLPLMEPAIPFTVTKYEVGEQELIPLQDNLWLIPFLDGYYSYEGCDFISMENYRNSCPELEKDGMMPFLAQGSEICFVFILLEKDGVYRLQRAEDMMGNRY